MKKCFISGSIKIKELNSDVKAYIEDIFEKKDTILVGDAMGVDKLVQMYCMKNEYYNVVVYSIYRNPRNYLCKKFRFKYIPIKNINRLSIMQKEKDEAMTLDCDYCLVVWNGKSKGSYANIIRALEYNKNVDVYLTNENKFLEKKYINKKYIDKVFKKNVGYTAKDIIKIMNSKEFKKASDIIYLLN